MTDGLLILLGGAVGAALRFWAGRVVLGWWKGGFPLGTFLINGLGSFWLGALYGSGVGGWVWALLGTGVLGAFTTFSTFGVEAVQLIERKRYLVAALYVLGSAFTGLSTAWLGFTWYTGG